MFITVMKSKIAYATLTGKELFYVGSITIDKDLMEQQIAFYQEEI